MDGISIVTDSKGKRTGLLIDIKELKKRRTSGRAVASYIDMLEDVEDIIDVQLAASEPSEGWETVKQRLKDSGHLSKDVEHPNQTVCREADAFSAVECGGQSGVGNQWPC